VAIEVSSSAARAESENLEVMSGGYLRAMHIPIFSGREFGQSDRSGSEPVAIVSGRWRNAFGPIDALDKRLEAQLRCPGAIPVQNI